VQAFFSFRNASCPWVVAHRAVFKGGDYGINLPTLKCPPKNFNTISAYLCSCLCHHIKQKYCIFFSPTAFCHFYDTQKVLKRCLWLRLHPDPAGGARDAPRTSSRLGRGCPLLDTFDVSISAPLAPHFREPVRIFSAYTTVVAQLYFLALDSRHFQEPAPRNFRLEPCVNCEVTCKHSVGYIVVSCWWRMVP